MTPNAAKKGRSFKGAVAYIIHDPDGAKTAERVLFTETRNLRTDDPEKAAKVMAYTAQHAAELKEAAGIKATGRKPGPPVYHLSLSWVPGEKPTQAEMMEAGTAILEKLGYGEHEAVFAAHGDKAHMHLHIIVNRVNPVTGISHNPKDDHKILHSWGHEYDKARGMEHHSPERAAKYEKDPEKKAEYRRMAEEARQHKGTANSKARADWEAAAGATHPKSKRYLDIKAEFAERIKNLARKGRDNAVRHSAQWEEIKARQANERAALWDKQCQAFKIRQGFNKASKAGEYSWQKYQADRAKLKKRHEDQMRALRARLKEENVPEVSFFMATQKEKRREFYKMNRTGGWAVLLATLEATIKTPLSEHGNHHRGHLSRFFTALVAKDARAAMFAKRLNSEKEAFFKKLDERNLPAFQRLWAKQNTELDELRTKYAEARDLAKKHAVQKIEAAKETDKQARTLLAARHKTERQDLKRQQAEETGELRKEWAALNADRRTAWDSYKKLRATQAERQKEDKSVSLADRYNNRASLFESYESNNSTEEKLAHGQARPEPYRDRGR
ncbi:Relaxase/Mobilisation nuclease domain-containing protein [Nitrosospira multiformis ATCC 25196]|uniref:Relaxase/Mobilisation nuclease domain-containing protein n=1 Tax=Nitrosospira multiformis (strain ATCC 25196 / NCIMB 11849 / C 71) TaxID=323848 RepID=Q2Y577_NITMU|nr:relaxase/mobilization nuclease domain-containing protein [Nitrosospira multiformis]ABB76094.1 Relaxase/mobilization nuclease domain [Nitrosospira multiformis ATCC 25196]SEG16600.1 Relaxase/Mobilisation nuclease domain-containing protein [Nitrosospira multiformis ATCC 25196]